MPPHRPRSTPKKPKPDVLPVVTRPTVFGPGFFLGPLGALARQECEVSGRALPEVRLHLADGELLEICHLVGVAPAFVVLAVHDDPDDNTSPRMRTELVPYDAILRVTIRASSTEESRIGFDALRSPTLLAPTGEASRSAEAMLDALAAPAAPPPPRAPAGRRGKRAR